MKNISKLFTLLLFVGLLATSCKDKAKDATVGAAKEVAKAVGVDYKVNTAGSAVMWIGEKPTGAHNGSLSIKEGKIAVQDGKITGGSFVLDMNSITVLDLEGDKKLGLEGHLKGSNADNADHFFNVAKYPTAQFDITKVVKREGAEDGTTHLVYGNLTIKDVSKQVGIPAAVNLMENGVHVTTPEFTINRTDWGINYKSKSILDNLKDGFINDDIKLKLDIKAQG